MCGAFFFGCGGEPGQREFRNGVKEMEQGNYVRAKASFEKSVNKRPGSDENAAAYNYIGIASWKLRQAQKAIEAFEYSRRLNSELPEPAYNLACVLFESGEPDRAAALLEEVAVIEHEDPRPLEFLGSIYAKQGKWQDARRVLFSALARAPQSARILTSLALVEVGTGGADKAVFYLTQALGKNRNYAPAIFDLAVLYQGELKDPKSAAEYFKQYVQVAGGDPHADYARRMLEDLAPAPVAVRAVAAVKEPGAESVASPVAPAPAPEPVKQDVIPPVPPPVAEAVKPVPPPVRESEPDVFARARAEAANGHVEDAVNMYLDAASKAERGADTNLQERILREAVKVCFDQAKVHYALGRFLLGRGANEQALNSFKQAAVLDRKFTPAYLGIADAAIKTGETDASLVALQQACQLEPGNPDVLWSLAGLYDQQLEMPERAVQTYRDFEKRFPGDPRVFKARERLKALEPSAVVAAPAETRRVAAPSAPPPPAKIVPKMQEAPVASTGARLPIRSTEIRNTHAAVQAYNRGTLYQQQEDWDRAIYYYIRAAENDDTFAMAFFNLGSAYWAKGEYALAKSAYQRAVQLMPDTTAARYNLALIDRELKDRSGAINELETLVKEHPEYAQAHYVLGLLYADDPKAMAQAKQHYGEFLKLAPNDPSASVVRSWIAAH